MLDLNPISDPRNLTRAPVIELVKYELPRIWYLKSQTGQAASALMLWPEHAAVAVASFSYRSVFENGGLGWGYSRSPHQSLYSGRHVQSAIYHQTRHRSACESHESSVGALYRPPLAAVNLIDFDRLVPAVLWSVI